MKSVTTVVVVVGLLVNTGLSIANDDEMPPIPEKVQRMLGKNIGHWTVSAKGTIIGETIFKWGPRQRYVTMEGEFQDGAISGVLCWDGLSENGFMMQGVAPAGYFTDRMKVVSESVAEGTRTGVMGGKHTSSSFRIEIQGPDQLMTSWTQSTTEGVKQPDIVEKCTRIKPTTREDFKALCQLFEGAWVGEATLEMDVPGVGKKGDKATAHYDISIVEDGVALLGKSYWPDGTNTWFVAYDEGRKQVTTMGISPIFGIEVSSLYRMDGKWHLKGSRSFPDGRRGNTHVTFAHSDNGSRFTASGTMIVDGETTAFGDVWRRMNK